jgi:hypothetical protein
MWMILRKMKHKKCNEPGCIKFARGKNDKCFAHGGGTRCNAPGCTKSSQGTTGKCTRHGGGNDVLKQVALRSLAGTPTDVKNTVE